MVVQEVPVRPMKQEPASGRVLRSRPRVPVFALSLVVLLFVWQAVVVGLQVPAFILPTPTAMGRALWVGLTADPLTKGSLLYHLALTLQGALIGYALGGIAGITTGVLVAESRALRSVLLPYAVALQSLPKVAIAPLILIWFGYGLPSAITMAALLTYFPLLINTFTGLDLVEEDYLLLMRGLKASRLQSLLMVKLPSALPVIFAGLDVAIVYSLLGALVAEFVAGSAGIGVAILQAQYINDTAGVFAALVVLALTANLLHVLVGWIERRAVFWRDPSAVRPARTPT